MEGRFYIDDPDYMNATLEITMTVAEWKDLRRGAGHITIKFKRIIDSIINRAETHFNEKLDTVDTA